MKLTDDETMQAITDALGALALAFGRQSDPHRLAADLRALADEANAAGQGASAGLIDVLARTVESREEKPPKGTPMELNIDEQELDIACPTCRQEITEKIGRLKHDPKLVCRCGQEIAIDAAELRAGIEGAQKILDRFGSDLS